VTARPLTLADLADTWAALAATSSRTAKATRLAQTLTGLGASDVALAVSYLSGELPQRQIGVGWASLREMPAPAVTSSITAADVDEAATAIGTAAGAGSQQRRRELLADLLGRATEPEQQFLARLLLGDLRQGALLGVMTEALARAFDAPIAEVRRAAMLRGELPAVAAALAEGGPSALAQFRLEVGRPISPMLAQTAPTIEAALDGKAASIEWKLDGARLQIHRQAGDVRLFTRTLDEVTARLPEIVDAVLAMPAESMVADGEAIALKPDGRPQPFQVTASRFGSRTSVAQLRERLPLSLFVFDVLHLDGDDLLDRPLTERRARLEQVVPEAIRVPYVTTSDPGQAQEFFEATLTAGHEGVLVKSIDAPYEAGRRGASWRKVKPVHTLDLVVLAVERGSGRRRQWLSNIHLGARDAETGELVMLGKTFKGMTDEMLRWQTERFTELAAGPLDGWVVPLRPQQVVEVAFDGVQGSTRYPGGVALRFARVLRYRDDKPVSEIDTVQTVRELQTS
jgi:ATP-dependent DNA ligase I